MNQSTIKPINLPELLRQFRQKHRLSINQLAKLSGISRRTLTRIEAGFYSSHKSQATGRGSPAVRSSKGVGGRMLSPRIAYRLAQLLLPPDQARQTVHGQADPFDLINEVLDPYPAFLFHHAPYRLRQKFAQEFAPDYSGAFFRLILMPERNLAQRLRAFRLQHGLTLKDTAYLLDLSLSHLHALETGQRSPSPRTRFRILRLLTLPFPATTTAACPAPSSGGHSFTCPEWNRGSRAERGALSPRGYARRHGSMPAGWVGGSTSKPRLDALKALLSIPPPEPIELADDSDCLHRLRYLWLTSTDSTRHLAARLGISQPHLIRLLRGDRRPSRSLRQRLELLTAPPCLPCLS